MLTLVVTKEYFEVDQLGIRLIREAPPLEVFEAAAYELKIAEDSLRWQIGDWAVLLANAHGMDTYEMLAGQVFNSLFTGSSISTMASIARRVPHHNRRVERSIWFHAAVAALEPTQQRRFLALCIDNDWSIRELKAAVAEERGEPAPTEPTRQDRLFELEQENYRLEVRYQEARQRVSKLEQVISRLQMIIDAITSNPGQAIQMIRELIGELTTPPTL